MGFRGYEIKKNLDVPFNLAIFSLLNIPYLRLEYSVKLSFIIVIFLIIIFGFIPYAPYELS
jgi:hypothetical protein